MTRARRSAILAALSVALWAVPAAGAERPDDRQYWRPEWGQWIDVEGDCWDTRGEALIRAGMAGDPDALVLRLERGSSCRVIALTFDDPYTGKRHTVQGRKVDVDHAVSLGDACRSGACGRPCADDATKVCGKWTAEQMLAFYNDPLNHIPTMEGVNGGKRDRDPGGQCYRMRRGVQEVAQCKPWFPPDRAFWCGYGSRRVAVKSKYLLTVDARELIGLMTLLAECAGPRQVEPLFPDGPILLPVKP